MAKNPATVLLSARRYLPVLKCVVSAIVAGFLGTLITSYMIDFLALWGAGFPDSQKSGLDNILRNMPSTARYAHEFSAPYGLLMGLVMAPMIDKEKLQLNHALRISIWFGVAICYGYLQWHTFVVDGDLTFVGVLSFGIFAGVLFLDVHRGLWKCLEWIARTPIKLGA